MVKVRPGRDEPDRDDAGDGAPETATSARERTVVHFGPGYVFASPRSSPRPAPSASVALPDPRIAGRARRRELARLDQSLTDDGWSVAYRQLGPGVGGECDHEHRAIAVSTDLEPDAQLRVLVHEAAHAEGTPVRAHGRVRAERIVESATFIVCARLGLDVSVSSVPYVAGWDSGDPGTSERDAAEINRVALAVERRLRDS